MILGDFESFCERNENGMYQVAFSLLHDSRDAEDAVQSAFEKIIRRLDSLDFQTEREEQVYTKRAARSAAIDMIRQRKPPEIVTDNDHAPYENAPLCSVCEEESYNEILETVGPKASAIFSYRSMGLSDTEIAAELGVSVSDVRTTVYRARTRLSKTLKQKGEAGCESE